MTTIFMDIDTQADFMDKDGKLYIPGAKEIVPNLKKLTEYLNKTDFKVISTQDYHFIMDEEFKEYPVHCVLETKGVNKIPETIMNKPRCIIPNKEHPLMDLTKLKRNTLIDYKKNFDWFIVQKQTTNVGTNINFKELIEIIGVDKVFIYGVATDICVKNAVDTLIGYGITDINVITDCCKGLKNESETLEYFKSKGCCLTKLSEVIN